jgi:hypothetical protein
LYRQVEKRTKYEAYQEKEHFDTVVRKKIIQYWFERFSKLLEVKQQ